LLPSALWDLDFRGPLEWIEAQGCHDADEFKGLVRNDPGALTECLNRTRIHRVSAGAVALVGASSKEECIRRSLELLTAESKADFLRVLMAAFRKERDVHLETAIMTCAREPRDVRVHWRFVEGKGGRFERAIASVVDMTAERELQQRLLLAERMSAIGTLTASIIHEIKNPLTFVWNHLRSLRDSGELSSPEAAELLGEAYEGAERIRVISNEITALSHGGDGAEVETVNLKQVLDSVIRMAQPEVQHRATVVREYEEGNLYIRGSRTRVSQVFLNLIVNAAQAIDPGDRMQNTITVRARSTDKDRVCIEVRSAGYRPWHFLAAAATYLRPFRHDETRRARNRSWAFNLSPHRALARRHDRDPKSPRARYGGPRRPAESHARAAPSNRSTPVDERDPARGARQAVGLGRRRRAGHCATHSKSAHPARRHDGPRRTGGGRLDGAERVRRDSM
jgi:signal transduction histidine kinase